jgi:predicted choloylglycine hydrolase
MERTLYAVAEDAPGPRWGAIYRHLEPGYRKWFLREGDAARPSYAVAIRALRHHMPELVPTYERLVELAGGGDGVARMLSLWCPTPYLTGCSQAVWRGDPPILVRNYDYHPGLWDAVQLSSAWTGRRVIGMLDSLWGVIDGINEDGLAVSLSFGGRQVVGEGFGMPLILRYVLETCSTVVDGVAALVRIPSHMSYNVTLLDAAGAHRTVFIAPDRPSAVTHRSLATNHQRVVEWEAFAHATASLDRERFLRARLAEPNEGAERFVARFLEAPLHQSAFGLGWGTLYTAVYEPRTRSTGLHWAGFSFAQSIDNFQETAVSLSFGGHPSPRTAP